MDVTSISGSALLRTQQVLTTTMMKQSADQQNKLATILAQNVQQAPQPSSPDRGSFSFSTYA